MADIKITRSNIPQWDSDFWMQNLLRLREMPTHEQLDVLKRHAQDEFGKHIVFDLFALIFSTFLDNMPDLPRLTPGQREKLYSQILMVCMELSTKWTQEFQARVEKGFSV